MNSVYPKIDRKTHGLNKNCVKHSVIVALYIFGPLAQLVEHLAHNRMVVGSNPTRSIQQAQQQQLKTLKSDELCAVKLYTLERCQSLAYRDGLENR